MSGLANRRAIRAELTRAREVADRHDGHLAVLAVDLPGIWAHAEEHGPAASEQLLRAMAAAWRAVLRPHDRLGRTSGGRFLAVLPGCHGDDALQVALRLRQEPRSTAAATSTRCWSRSTRP